MPQMAPLNWISLFFYFVILLFTFNIMNYFIFNYLPKKNIKTSKTMKINWKW